MKRAKKRKQAKPAPGLWPKHPPGKPRDPKFHAPQVFRYRIESLYGVGLPPDTVHEIMGGDTPREWFGGSAHDLCTIIAEDIVRRSTTAQWSFRIWIDEFGVFEVKPRTGFAVEQVR